MDQTSHFHVEQRLQVSVQTTALNTSVHCLKQTRCPFRCREPLHQLPKQLCPASCNPCVMEQPPCPMCHVHMAQRVGCCCDHPWHSSVLAQQTWPHLDLLGWISSTHPADGGGDVTSSCPLQGPGTALRCVRVPSDHSCRRESSVHRQKDFQFNMSLPWTSATEQSPSEGLPPLKRGFPWPRASGFLLVAFF